MIVDSHNHLQSESLNSYIENLPENFKRDRVQFAVVNGTTEADWPTVAALAKRHPELIHPAFGLHPWYLSDRSPNWFEQLRKLLSENPHASIGECGLDHWMSRPDKPLQQEIFIQHLSLVHELKRPLTVHCLKAWGRLLDILENESPPLKGFLLHSYSGPVEMIERFTEMGAYFSFSGYFLRPDKTQHLERFLHIPAHRLLLETDSPSMEPPSFATAHDERHLPPSSPANLPLIAQYLAKFLKKDPNELISQTTHNALKFYV